MVVVDVVPVKYSVFRSCSVEFLNLDHFHLKFMIIKPKIHNPKSYLQAASGNVVPKSVLTATRGNKVTLLEIQTFNTDVIQKKIQN